MGRIRTTSWRSHRYELQGGGGTRIPNQGLGGGGPAEGRKKNSDLTDFDGGSGR